MTYNFTNPDPDCKNGLDMHVDLAASILRGTTRLRTARGRPTNWALRMITPSRCAVSR
jgi:hypothetical protein